MQSVRCILQAYAPPQTRRATVPGRVKQAPQIAKLPPGAVLVAASYSRLRTTDTLRDALRR